MEVGQQFPIRHGGKLRAGGGRLGRLHAGQVLFHLQPIREGRNGDRPLLFAIQIQQLIHRSIGKAPHQMGAVVG